MEVDVVFVRSDPPPALDELSADVDVEVVCVTVTVTVPWVVCDRFPEPELLAVSPEAAEGDAKIWAAPFDGEDAPPLNACVATTIEPAPASTTRVKTDRTDSF
jgi:hypothetical protein